MGSDDGATCLCGPGGEGGGQDRGEGGGQETQQEEGQGDTADHAMSTVSLHGQKQAVRDDALQVRTSGDCTIGSQCWLGGDMERRGHEAMEPWSHGVMESWSHGVMETLAH